MEKTFTTILSFLYLVSGIGYGSVYHHCHNNLKMMSLSEAHCCSAETETGSSETCQKPEKSKLNSCCNSVASKIQHMENEAPFPDECCAIQLRYNQLGISSLTLIVDLTQAAETISELSHNYPQYEQNISDCALRTSKNPSTQINIPLLI